MKTIEPKCPVCQAPLSQGAQAVCDECGTGHHRECWDNVGRCSIYGCSEEPVVEFVPAPAPTPGAPLPPPVIGPGARALVHIAGLLIGLPFVSFRMRYPENTLVVLMCGNLMLCALILGGLMMFPSDPVPDEDHDAPDSPTFYPMLVSALAIALAPPVWIAHCLVGIYLARAEQRAALSSTE